MNIAFDAVTEAEAVQLIMDDVEAGRGGSALTPNLDILRQLSGDPGLSEIPRSASLVLADGMPIVWASRLLPAGLPERVAGSSLIWSLSRASAQRGTSVYLLGGNPGAAEGAACRLTEAYPDLDVVGSMCPPIGYEHDAEQFDRIVARVVAARPGLVFVGLPFLKQERLIARLRPTVPETFFLGCGVSLSFVSGEISRAPALVQAVGLEWAHRLMQEPRRLFKRYVVHDLPFAASLAAHVVGRRLGSRRVVNVDQLERSHPDRVLRPRRDAVHEHLR